MQTKYWLNSTTVRAALLGGIPAVYAVARLFGLDLPDGTLEDVVNGIAAVLNIVSIVGVFMGRFKANAPLTTDKMP